MMSRGAGTQTPRSAARTWGSTMIARRLATAVVSTCCAVGAAHATGDDAPALTDLGPGTPGLLGTPALAAVGVPVVDSPFVLTLGGGVNGGAALLFAGPGAGAAFVPKVDGAFYPVGPLLTVPLVLGPGGGLALPVLVDASLCGVEVALQAVLFDGSATGGAALSNGLGVAFGVAQGPLFASPAQFVVAARELARGDVDGDGRDDVVSASTGSSGGAVLLAGDGALAAADDVDAGGSAIGVALGDIDGDGNLDAVFARSGAQELTVTLGLGDGGFAPPLVAALGLFPRAVAVGDVDGDGDLDAVASGVDADAVEVLLGDGAGGLSSLGAHPVGDRPFDVALADLDADGALDLVVAHDGVDGVGVALGQGDGSFAATTFFAAASSSRSLAIASLDAGGTLDVVVAGGGGARLLRGNGDGTLGAPLVVGVGLSPDAAVLVDVDDDGFLDLATTDVARGEVFVRLGNASGPFGPGVRVPAVPGVGALAALDVDADGDVDLCAASLSVVATLRGDGAGDFDVAADVASSNRPVAVDVVDLTGDGVLDLLVAHDVTSSGGGITLNAGVGDGTFGAPTFIPSDNQIPRDVVAADMDGDGLLDIVVGNAVGSVRVRPGSVPGFVFDTGFFATSGPADAIAVADLDGDGALDVLASSGGGEWLPGAGDGTLGAAVSLGLGLGFVPDVVADDVDGDGILDVVALDGATDAVVVALGLGGGLFAAPQAFGVGDGPTRVGVGDVDGDGAADLVVANGGIGTNGATVAVLRGLGGGDFAPATFHGQNVGDGLALIDVDRDGHLDVVTSDGFFGTVSVLFGAGDGSFPQQSDHAGERRPDPVAAADLDGDGLPDLVAVHLDDASLTVFRNQLLD